LLRFARWNFPNATGVYPFVIVRGRSYIHTAFSAVALVLLIMPRSGFGQAEQPQDRTPVDNCWQPGAVQLSAAQTKARLRHTEPITPPGLSLGARINAVLVFKVGADKDGNVTCIQAVSGHPLLVPGALQSIRSWKFRTAIGRKRRPIAGTLILSVSWTERGFETKVLDEEPARR
jgi:hypothetical protein